MLLPILLNLLFSDLPPSPLISTTPSKDVRLPVQLQRAMAAEAEAAREARAKVIVLTITMIMKPSYLLIICCQVITAEGEQKASRALR